MSLPRNAAEWHAHLARRARQSTMESHEAVLLSLDAATLVITAASTYGYATTQEDRDLRQALMAVRDAMAALPRRTT